MSSPVSCSSRNIWSCSRRTCMRARVHDKCHSAVSLRSRCVNERSVFRSNRINHASEHYQMPGESAGNVQSSAYIAAKRKVRNATPDLLII
eukprot:343245-Chlamydomonas_euryale.AAC.2